MNHINTGNSLPGINGLLKYSPHTAVALNALAEVLLRSDEGLSRGERELIFTAACWMNSCRFCSGVHAQCAAEYLGADVVEAVKVSGPCELMGTNDKLHELVHIATEVAKDVGQPLDEQSVQLARNAGATDRDIHDTVLIAAAACMFSRYVDALNADVPKDEAFYKEAAKMLVQNGYLNPKETRSNV